VLGVLRDNRLELHCTNKFIAESVDKPEILEVVSRKAGAMLGRPVRVFVVDLSAKPAGNARLDQILQLTFSNFSPEAIEQNETAKVQTANESSNKAAAATKSTATTKDSKAKKAGTSAGKTKAKSGGSAGGKKQEKAKSAGGKPAPSGSATKKTAEKSKTSGFDELLITGTMAKRGGQQEKMPHALADELLDEDRSAVKESARITKTETFVHTDLNEFTR